MFVETKLVCHIGTSEYDYKGCAKVIPRESQYLGTYLSSSELSVMLATLLGINRIYSQILKCVQKHWEYTQDWSEASTFSSPH